jgi:hypothetical protein
VLVPSDARTATELAEPVQAEPHQAEAAASADVSAPASDRWRWWVLAALVLGFALQVAWRLWLARTVTTPVAHADEDRYLLSARVLAGGPGGLGNDTAAFRRMGYPLLLAPIYQFTSDAFKVYHAAQAVGAVVNALTFPLAYLFGRRVLGIPRGWLALALAFVVSLLPAAVYYAEFTLTDSVFAPLGLAWLVLLHGWMTGRSAWSRTAAAVGAGAVVGYMYTVHVRGMILLAIHLAVLAVAVVVRRSWWKVAVASAGAAVTLSLVNLLAGRLVGNRLVTGGVEPQGRLFQRLTTAGGLVHTFCDAVGQLWYAGVGTWGLAAVGMFVAVDRIRGRDVQTVDRAQRSVLAVALAATVFIALSSAAALPNDGRVSNHAYFRYIAFLAPVFVMLGLVSLVRAGWGRAWSLIGRAAAGIAIGAFLVLSRMTDVTREWLHPFDTPEVSAMTYSWSDLAVAQASVIAIVLLILVTLALAAPRSRTALYGLAGVAALCVATMLMVNAKAIGPMAATEYRYAPRLVQDLHIGPADTVVSSKRVSLGGRLNHQREVYWQRVAEFDHETVGPPADATVVIAPWKSRNNDDWDGSKFGWRLVASDPSGEWAVWLRQSDPRVETVHFRAPGP